jgi:hypothetical protein
MSCQHGTKKSVHLQEKREAWLVVLLFVLMPFTFWMILSIFWMILGHCQLF